jgi:DNA polymerase I-like protein with 3'-5' exonuclease and polymerase domains
METYFKTFPQLSEFFKQSGQNALKFNYREPYFGRVRFFNKPKNGMEASHNKMQV